MTMIVTNAALECDTVWFRRSVLMFRRNVLPAFPGYESKLRHGPVQTNRSKGNVKNLRPFLRFPVSNLFCAWLSLLLLI
jgi:hypothetical protein